MKGCRLLTDDEVKRVRQSFHGRYAKRNEALVVLGVACGFRISELLSLRVGDVLQHGRIVDRVTVARRFMKGGKTQTPQATARRSLGGLSLYNLLPPTESATGGRADRPLASTGQGRLECMAGWVGKAFGASRGEGAGDHLPGLLLPCALAGRPSLRPIARDTAWRALNAVFNALELQGQVGTHCLRKIFANAVHEANHYDLPKTQKALGHRNINSTLAYLSFREEDVELAILAAASRVLAA